MQAIGASLCLIIATGLFSYWRVNVLPELVEGNRD